MFVVAQNIITNKEWIKVVLNMSEIIFYREF